MFRKPFFVQVKIKFILVLFDKILPSYDDLNFMNFQNFLFLKRKVDFSVLESLYKMQNSKIYNKYFIVLPIRS